MEINTKISLGNSNNQRDAMDRVRLEQRATQCSAATPGGAKPETWGAAVRITHLWRLFRSCFCNSVQLFCRMCTPIPQ